MSRLGDRVKEVRKALGLRQREVAANSGDAKLNGNYVSKIEAGLEQNPGWLKLESVARGLGVDVGVITAPVGDPIPIAHKATGRTKPDKTSSAVGGKNRGSEPKELPNGRPVSPTLASDSIDRLEQLASDLFAAVSDARSTRTTAISEQNAQPDAKEPRGGGRSGTGGR